MGFLFNPLHVTFAAHLDGPPHRALSTFEVTSCKGTLYADLVASSVDRKPSGDVRQKLVKGQLAPPAIVPPEIGLPPYAKTKQPMPFTEAPEIHDEEVWHRDTSP